MKIKNRKNKFDIALSIILEFAQKWADGGHEETRVFNESKNILIKELNKLEEYKFKYKELEK